MIAWLSVDQLISMHQGTHLNLFICNFFFQPQSDSELDNSTDLNSEVFSSLPRNFKLNRSRLSDEFGDGRAKRRESFGFPSSRLDESSNLLRMRANPSLGSSEPNLTGSCVSKQYCMCMLKEVLFGKSWKSG